jgi:hypothetical protein
MYLNEEQKKTLLRRLPNLELSYENSHNKVHCDLYYLIPKGRKQLVWFTYIEDKKICAIIEIVFGTKKMIKEIYVVPQKFEKKIVLGTLFYGTLFSVNNKKYLSIENIHFYKGKNVEQKNENEKLLLIKYILQNEIKQLIISKRGIGLGLPIIVNDYSTAIQIAKKIEYPIYSIQLRNLKDKKKILNSILFKNNKYENNSNNKNVNRVTFYVKALIQNDIYELYCINNSGNEENIGIAYIPDYSTSVMMNKLFRNIKENINLDALEESDDEEEFENIDEDKFVNLNKKIKMECVYNEKFEKFIPLKISNHPVTIKKDIVM